ncbi:MAG TPA: alpha/beta hydrolase [Woeseiaceae bacterium]|nr:alpha/beta hydrolase [Woeseiaceae bacterium]
MSDCERTTLTAADGHVILLRHWRPASAAPRAAVQIFHGLAEHAGRYQRFARQCTARGYAVTAHDHRGHGELTAAGDLGHFADRGGWDKVLADGRLVQEALRRRDPGLPLILLGHSMGSYLAQHFVMRHPKSVQALLLSGSTLAPRLKLRAGRWVAHLERLLHGPAYRSARLDALGFGAFNRRFQPARTAFDWLSRDAREVDRYLADPLCGAPASAGLWCDLLGGLLAISSTRAARRIPADLPILITGGAEDPVGGARGMRRLAAIYRKNGHGNVSLRVYADGRHEMLNELNREAFTADLLQWMDGATTTA